MKVTTDDVMSVLHLLSERLGYSFRQPGSKRLQKFLENRAQSIGDPTVEAYVARCERDAMELQQLINVVTNGFTAFFRDQAQLDAIRQVLKEGGVETIWCAGCSTGEEAYTLSAIAEEVGADIQIVATDINTSALEQARNGFYEAWSLRLMESGDEWKLLEEIDEGLWSVKPHIRKRVRFEHHNLMTKPPIKHADVVICRNVLIYFSEPGMERCLTSFRKVMGSNGLLVLGSSEQLVGEHPFEVNAKAGGFVYQVRAGSLSLPSAVSSVSSAIDEDASKLMSKDALEAIALSGLNNIATEDYDDAIACFEAALAYDPFWSDVHSLTGHCMEKKGAALHATDAYTKAIFLDPNHWWSAYRSAVVWSERGESASARRHAKVAKRLVAEGHQTDKILRTIIDKDVDEILRELQQLG